MYKKGLVYQDSKWNTCIEINEEYGSNLDLLSLLQIKESIPSTWKIIQEDNTDTLNCPLHVFDLLPVTKFIFNKILYNVIFPKVAQSPVNAQIHWERECLTFEIY